MVKKKNCGAKKGQIAALVFDLVGAEFRRDVKTSPWTATSRSTHVTEIRRDADYSQVISRWRQISDCSQKKGDVHAAFHPHLQKKRAKHTQTTHCKAKKNNNQKDCI